MGGWNAWEWVNPPMLLGVEYRTVYRNNEKPVYAKLVNCGYLPNATTKTIAYSDDDACYPIFVTGRGGGTIMPSNSFGGQLATSWNNSAVVSFWASGKTIYISCGGDRSSNPVVAIVFYGKSTD